MKMNAYVAGVGMLPFGKHLDKTLKGLAGQAIQLALNDAGIEAGELQAAWMGNAAAGVVTGQEMIRGQVVLRGMGIGRIPVVNVENACASSSTAFHQACAMVSAGYYDIVLACGYEKLFHQDKARSLGAFSSAVDVEDPDGALNVVKKLAEAAGARGRGGAVRRRRCGGQSFGVHGHLRDDGQETHETVRHPSRTLCHGHREKLLPRQPQPTGAVS
ncbi:hypothetical protein F753_15960 [Stutzerimonas chloritidismutans AW-1]|uniref:Thiolase N-terminal domain-containing protein n=1 Tax=Stutzerimonas chloritidismutans AW-1 TaxID=1263865 RepID=V4Q6P6_STUCH|nr:beta-ketoacyl synthase N-terminal-like domain-containing protein [Stutzerimonas chloritidismutans]ESQ98394.1 hypothetical protein F753_15960 [Stutzerimonas chloritidismutans AW-1]